MGASVCLLALVTCGRSPLDLPPTGAAGIGGTGTGASTVGGTSGGGTGTAGGPGGGVTGGGGIVFLTGSAGAGGVAGASAGSSGTAGQSDGGLATDLKMTGQSCAAGINCASGFCANGVCCMTACDGSCQSCALPESPGRCAPLPVNSVCAPARCDGNTRVTSSTCDGSGTCQAPGRQECAPFACDPTTGNCQTKCAVDADCFNSSCVDGLCGFLGIAAKCARDSECTSGFCTDGFCCNLPCLGPCVSCAMPGKLGTCSALPAGVFSPFGACVDQGAASCGMNGRCDGSGGCAHYPAGTICAGAVCPTTLMPIAGACTAQGTCVVSVQSCGP
jgi:hypothetical protein